MNLSGLRDGGSTVMLTQTEADDLLELVKILIEQRAVALPQMGEQKQFGLKDDNTGKIKFTVDMQRKNLNAYKITYQTRARGVILLRLDTHGAPHPNPDDTEVPCPHLHVYKEGYGDSWAYPLSEHIITDTNDLVQVLIDFLVYNNVKNVPEIRTQGDELV